MVSLEEVYYGGMNWDRRYPGQSECVMFTTLEDVAQAAGCSLATVSRAINGSSLVSEDVRAKVSAAVQRTGYKPRRRRSPGGKAAASGTTGMPVINILFYRSQSYEPLKPTAQGVKVGAPHAYHAPDLQSPQFRQSNSFEQGLLEGLLAACSHFQLKAGIISTDNLADAKLLEEVGGTEHGGLIIGGIYPEGLDGFLAQCRQPVVLLDMLHKGAPDVITSDNIDGIRQSVTCLAALGHREIGFVGTHDNPSYYERYFAFLAAMAEAGLGVRPEFVVNTPGGVAETAKLVTPLLASRERPTALVACSDYYAIAVMEAARGCGLQVPRDLSVIGFDDVTLAQRMKPALTTVRVPVQELGWRAVAQLLPLPHAGRAVRRTTGAIVRVPVELVVRETCAAPRKK